MEQRITKIEQRLDNLEKQEREYSFTVRDIAHKVTIGLGIATAQESDIKEMRADIVEIRSDIVEIKTTQNEQGRLLREQGQKLDLILQLLQPKQ